LVVVHPNDGQLPRLGLSVSKRALKRAVERNRVRRLLREAFRLECAALPAGFDVILAPTAAALEQPLAAYRAELQRLAWAACRRFGAPSPAGQALGSQPSIPVGPRPTNRT
jgi:ribonuclease P protein component